MLSVLCCIWCFSISKSLLILLSGDKDDDDDDDADDKMQSSVLTGGEEGRQESQEQSEVDHGDFEMVVSKVIRFLLRCMLKHQMDNSIIFCLF